MTAQWQDLIFAYLRGRASLRRVVLLIDARRGVLELDRETMALLDEAAVSFAIVLTKIDKLAPDEIAKATSAADREARKHTAAFAEISATSALRGTGLEPLKVQLAALADPR